MLEKARVRTDAYDGKIELQAMDVHDMTFPDHSFDQVFTSCTFCSVPRPVEGLKALRRVLRPGGELHMFEHTGSRYWPFNSMLNQMTWLSKRFGPDMNRGHGQQRQDRGLHRSRRPARLSRRGQDDLRDGLSAGGDLAFQRAGDGASGFQDESGRSRGARRVSRGWVTGLPERFRPAAEPVRCRGGNGICSRRERAPIAGAPGRQRGRPDLEGGGMGLRIGSQPSAANLFARRQLVAHTQRAEKAYERLSSGRRINRAADGAAELSIAEKFRAAASSVARSRLNMVDALSSAQVGEAALNETSGILIRVRELAVQAANGTVGDRERELIAEEAEGLLEEVDRISSTTRFAGSFLLSGALLGRTTTDPYGIDPYLPPTIDASSTALGLSGIDLATDASSAAGAFATIDQAIDRVSADRAELGSDMNVLESRIRQSLVEEENLRAAESRIVDADFAAETAELARAQILQQTTIAVIAQERVQNELVLKLIDSATASA
jgi:flagellin